MFVRLNCLIYTFHGLGLGPGKGREIREGGFLRLFRVAYCAAFHVSVACSNQTQFRNLNVCMYVKLIRIVISFFYTRCFNNAVFWYRDLKYVYSFLWVSLRCHFLVIGLTKNANFGMGSL